MSHVECSALFWSCKGGWDQQTDSSNSPPWHGRVVVAVTSLAVEIVVSVGRMRRDLVVIKTISNIFSSSSLWGITFVNWIVSRRVHYRQ